MPYNRELSQFASFLGVNDTSKRIGISTDINVSGVVTANYYYGDGRYLTNIVASFVPSGPTKSIQLNNGGYPAGANNFFYDTGTDNVGVGTSTPTSRLQIYANTTTPAVKITQAGSGNAFTVEDAVNDTTPFIIKSDGSVGIATTNPATNVTLHVNGIAHFSDRIGVGFTNPSSSTRVAIAGTLGLSEVGGAGNRTLITSTTTGLIINHNDSQDIIFQTNSTNRFRWRHASSALLIGADTPTGTANQRLQVAGGAYFNGSLGINFAAPTSALYVDGDSFISGVTTSANFNITGQYRAGNVPVIDFNRRLLNITAGAIVGINSNGTYVGAGLTTLDFVGTGVSVRVNNSTSRIEVAMRDDGILGSYVEDAKDMFGHVPFEKSILSNETITIGTQNAGVSSSYVIGNFAKLVIEFNGTLNINSGKVVVINPLGLNK